MAFMFAVILSCYFVATGAQQNGDVRLAAGSIYRGRVEIYLNAEWGTVRYSSEVEQRGVAQAICHQLGFWDGYGNTVSQWNISQADSNVPTLLANVSCSPFDGKRHILRCSYKQDHGSGHSDDMAVTCVNSGFSIYDGDVRLVEGKTTYKSEGYLEVYFSDSWGGVCNVNQYDADSACRQLGYTNAIHHISDGSYVGNMTKLNSFTCNSRSYPCLYNCFFVPRAGAMITCSQHSYITCTYDQNSHNSDGSESLCSMVFIDTQNLVAIIVGVMVGLLVLIVLICVGVCVCCCCIPGCILHNRRSRGSYQAINS